MSNNKNYPKNKHKKNVLNGISEENYKITKL